MNRKLTGRQIESFRDALTSAFPQHSSLAQMVKFELSEDLDTIVMHGSGSEVAFRLVTWADSNGRIDDLAKGARHQNPNNHRLCEFLDSLDSSADLPPNTNNADPNDQAASWRRLLPVPVVALVVSALMLGYFIFYKNTDKENPPAIDYEQTQSALTAFSSELENLRGNFNASSENLGDKQLLQERVAPIVRRIESLGEPPTGKHRAHRAYLLGIGHMFLAETYITTDRIKNIYTQHELSEALQQDDKAISLQNYIRDASDPAEFSQWISSLMYNKATAIQMQRVQGDKIDPHVLQELFCAIEPGWYRRWPWASDNHLRPALAEIRTECPHEPN